MRKVIVLEHISLDGVIQAPGGPEEDTGDGFAYGGWAAPYDDDILGAALQKQMNMPFDLLLGRKTFDIWAAFKVTESIVGSNGVIVVNYERAGAITTGGL